MGGEDLGPNRLGRIIFDGFAGDGIVARGDLGEPDFEEIGQLRHGADGGTRGLYGIRLLDGDGRTDVFDGVDFGFIEQVEKLAGVGGESLDVAALALGVEGVEDEGGFAGAAESGDDDVATKGQIEIEALEVVLADATKTNALRCGGGWASGRGNGTSDFFNHRSARMDTESKKANAEAPARMLADNRGSGVNEVIARAARRARCDTTWSR